MPYRQRLREVMCAFAPMGFVAFGGPQAHIALFLKTFVEDRKWLDEQRFMELMSLGQAMPGPTSTQMATAMGISRAGALGGLISFWLFDWVGFAVQLAVGTAVHQFGRSASTQALLTYKMAMVGMGPAAISQVYLAAFKLSGKAIGTDPIKIVLAMATMAVALLVSSAKGGGRICLPRLHRHRGPRHLARFAPIGAKRGLQTGAHPTERPWHSEAGRYPTQRRHASGQRRRRHVFVHPSPPLCTRRHIWRGRAARALHQFLRPFAGSAERRRILCHLRLSLQDGHLDLRRWAGRAAHAGGGVRVAHRLQQRHGRWGAGRAAHRRGDVWLWPRARPVDA